MVTYCFFIKNIKKMAGIVGFEPTNAAVEYNNIYRDIDNVKLQ